MIGATSAAISWTAVEWSTTPHPSILGMLSGAISGLIALSPCVGYVDQTGAFIIGIIAGFFCYAGSDYRDLKKLDKTLKFEDLMGTFTLNFIGGVVGSFLLGFFANNRNGKLDFQNGAFYGNPEQVIILDAHLLSACSQLSVFLSLAVPFQIYLQIYGIVISTCWSAVGTVVIFFVVDKLCGGIRVDKIYEEVGLDIAQLGVTVVAMPKNKLDREIQRVLDFENGRNRPEDVDLDVGNHGNEKREAGGDDMDEQGPSILM
jgi:ammonium transporter, Amt family